MKTNYTISTPLKDGETRFKIVFEGFGVEFSTEIDAKDKDEAREKFKRCYSYVAEIKQILKSRNGNSRKTSTN